MDHLAVVAGLLVRSPEPLAGLPAHGFHDGEVRLRLVERGAAGDWIDLPAAGAVTLRVRNDGAELEAAPPAVTPQDLAAAVRAAAPFAAALQGRVTLHAAGIELERSVTAIVGASGSGKSTLARALGGRGLTIVADDLLACRLEAGAVVAPSGTDASGSQRLIRLSAVFFLGRAPGLPRPRVERLDGRSCFRQLVRQGFGEIGVAAAWAAQTDLYHRVADRVPAFDVTIPDDLERVVETARWLEALCRRHA